MEQLRKTLGKEKILSVSSFAVFPLTLSRYDIEAMS